MSQCYHVCLKQSVTRRIEGEDAISYPLELTEILPAAEMKELLRTALEQAGWEVSPQNPDLYTKVQTGEIILSVDLAAMEVTATIRDEQEISTEVTASGDGDSKRAAEWIARRALDETAARTGDALEEKGRRHLRDSLRVALENSEESRQRQLHDLLQQVYGEALKRKAAELGEILEIQESASGDEYELVIRVAQ